MPNIEGKLTHEERQVIEFWSWCEDEKERMSDLFQQQVDVIGHGCYTHDA